MHAVLSSETAVGYTSTNLVKYITIFWPTDKKKRTTGSHVESSWYATPRNSALRLVNNLILNLAVNRTGSSVLGRVNRDAPEIKTHSTVLSRLEQHSSFGEPGAGWYAVIHTADLSTVCTGSWEDPWTVSSTSAVFV